LSKTYVGDVGTIIIVDIGESVSAATYTALKVRKPGADTEYIWSGEVYNTNYVKYTTVDGDFSIAGQYHVQPHIITSTWDGLGETITLTVFDPFE